MTIRKRLVALEARSNGDALSPLVRRWLGHELTSGEAELAAHEAAQPHLAVDWTRISKEAREWLLG